MPASDLSVASVNFFFEQYLSPQRYNPLLSEGRFDFLPSLYGNVAPSSALGLAAGLMGAHTMYLYQGFPQNDRMLIEQEVAANRAVRQALLVDRRDEELFNQNLLAILCLDFAEHAKSRGINSHVSDIPIRGAAALVKTQADKLSWSKT